MAVAVSGGVDSLVSAYLLKQQGLDIIGVHFLTGFESPTEPTWEVGRQLFIKMEIPVSVIDLQIPFAEKVVDYFTAAYGNGKTPNPCLVCNSQIKFDLLMKEAARLGASRLATGHYARVVEESDCRWSLRKGLDLNKDQSYFLSRLTQDQLAHACFPLGRWTKKEVKALAAERGLEPIVKKESQDVCFIKDTDYADFLVKTHAIKPKPGDIVNTAGDRIGTHNGLYRYTVGQRRGINCPAGEAYYVVRLEVQTNRLVVGFKPDIYTTHCRVTDVNWIVDIPVGPIHIETRIRYRHRAVSTMVTPIGKVEAEVRFDEPQMAVTPGQGAVFYQGDKVLGGGWIATPCPSGNCK